MSTTSNADLPEFEDDFENIVIVRADEPPAAPGEGVTITRAEFDLCAAEPVDVVVLLHWRAREMDDRPRTAEAIWETFTELGFHGSDYESPIRLDEVQESIRRLTGQGIIAGPTGGSA